MKQRGSPSGPTVSSALPDRAPVEGVEIVFDLENISFADVAMKYMRLETETPQVVRCLRFERHTA